MSTRWMFGAALLALCGCTAMERPAGTNGVSEHVSARDHATVIELSPHALYTPKDTRGTPLQMGARWTSDKPQSAVLALSYESTVSSTDPTIETFEYLQVSIDGRLSSFPASKPNDLSSSFQNPISHTFHVSSRGEVQVPYSLLQRMVTSKNCWLRAGSQDVKFSVDRLPDGKPTALVSLRTFLAKVDAARGSEGAASRRGR